MSTGTALLARTSARRWPRAAAYWALIKDLQTGLLLLTAVAAYGTGCCRNLDAPGTAAMLGSLFLAVSGCTALNMVLDRDIDGRMARTAARPLPSGQITPAAAGLFGGVLALAGVTWAFTLNLAYGAVVLTGLLFDILIYTAWLKRRTPFSVLIGGLAGAMPALAGRTLAVGRVDAVGLLLAGVILCWIPTHIMTLHIRHADDYRRASIPTFPAVFGVGAARVVIIASTVLTWLLMLQAGASMGLPAARLYGLAFGGGLLTLLAVLGAVRGGAGLNFALYKGASVYMLVGELLLLFGAL